MLLFAFTDELGTVRSTHVARSLAVIARLCTAFVGGGVLVVFGLSVAGIEGEQRHGEGEGGQNEQLAH